MRKTKLMSSIGFRLSLAVVTAVFAGVLISVSFFLFNDFRQTIAAERERLQSSTAAFAAALSDSVANRDRRGALAVLRGIRSLAHVNFAIVRDAEGGMLAEIGTGAMLLGRDGALEAKGALATFLADTLTVEAEVRHGGIIVGSVELQSEIAWLRQRYLNSLAAAVAFGIVLMLLTAVAARMRIARIIGPLTRLAEEFADIGERSDLTKRLVHDRQDEVGVLVGAFNDMFSRIDERDRQLRRHRDTLEETVETRTAEMRAARDDAERANTAKSDFLATMSHEIRTPMNGMMVMAEMLSAAPLSKKHQRYADIITRSGHGLLNIINDILDFSKIESGRLQIEAIPFSIDTLAEDVASLFAERAREKGLTVAIYVAPDVPERLIGDPTRINQVITNLVNNALKFTEEGGVTIEVDASPAAGGHRLGVHIRDTGIGIPQDKIGRIFERFAQADQTITRKFGGTGLGLAISRRLVDAMGGELTVASEPGRGSDFSFALTLPVEVAAEATMLRDLPVMIVDDNPLTAAAAGKAMLARGARLVGQDDDTVPRLVLLHAADSRDASPAIVAAAHVVLMRPFSVSGGTPDGIEPAGEIQLPLRRSELDIMARCLLSGDFAPMGDDNLARRTLVELPDLSGLQVLGVDDTAVNREVLNEALGGFGIAPDLAASGEEAIEKVRARTYDVIFMDCSMPGMDGYQATAGIRAIEAGAGRRSSTVIALTAHVAGAEAERWKSAGMDGYVAKPFTVQQLGSVLASGRVYARGGDPVRPGAIPEVAHPVIPAGSSPEEPLIAPETLEMFATLSAAGGASVAGKIFGLFRKHAPKGLADLQASAGGAPGEAAKLAHALKSMCSSAGARRAAMLCEDIEAAQKRGEHVAPDRLDELEAAIASTIAEMDRQFPMVEQPLAHTAARG